jgi:hypothetical protein
VSRKKAVRGRPRKQDAKRVVFTFRGDESLGKRIDRHVKRLNREAPGGNWSRSSAALNLILRALEQAEEGGA